MNDRLQLLSEAIQQKLPEGVESGYKDPEFGGAEFFVFEHGREVSRSKYDLDQLQDYSDNELVQFVLRDFAKSKLDH